LSKVYIVGCVFTFQVKCKDIFNGMSYYYGKLFNLCNSTFVTINVKYIPLETDNTIHHCQDLTDILDDIVYISNCWENKCRTTMHNPVNDYVYDGSKVVNGCKEAIHILSESTYLSLKLRAHMSRIARWHTQPSDIKFKSPILCRLNCLKYNY
jgi:hypothetical protein